MDAPSDTNSASKANPVSVPAQGGSGEVSIFRRKFIRRAGWGALFAALGISSAGIIRFFYPRILFELPTAFKIGTLGDYPEGSPDQHGVVSISGKYMEEHRAWIVREQRRIYAIFGKCTHLGCTPRLFSEDSTFRCPCHGSRYYSNGVNFAGPAPRPMDRYEIYQMEDGRIVVDKSKLYTFKEFDNNKAYVNV